MSANHTDGQGAPAPGGGGEPTPARSELPGTQGLEGSGHPGVEAREQPGAPGLGEGSERLFEKAAWEGAEPLRDQVSQDGEPGAQPSGATEAAGTAQPSGAQLAGSAELGDAAEAARQRDEYLDALRRLQAEFDNYRKRVERQHREVVERAASALVLKLLPVLDTADLAMAHGAGEDVKQIASALFETLAGEGLERIDPEGQAFDPEHHDAVAHEPAIEESLEQPGPQVSEVLRAGYRWKGRVLRPAMVKVRG
ncbi:MAG: nucleotide exchange factor GrpE [Acidimicrobiales bacterium]